MNFTALAMALAILSAGPGTALTEPARLGAAAVQAREHDPVWQGALAGAAIGIGVGFAMPGRCDDGECTAEPLIIMGALGAGIGALIDALWSRDPSEPPKQRRTVLPGVSAKRGGFVFQIRWRPR